MQRENISALFHERLRRDHAARDGDKIVALIRLRVANPRISFLPVLQSFVDSELRTLEILNAQHENLGWPQAAYRENPQYEVFTRRRL
jgi:hypothetical protein